MVNLYSNIKMMHGPIRIKYLTTILNCSPSASSQTIKQQATWPPQVDTAVKRNHIVTWPHIAFFTFEYSYIQTTRIINLTKKRICVSALWSLSAVLRRVSSAEYFLSQDAIKKDITVFATFRSFYLSVNPMRIGERQKMGNRQRKKIIGN